MANESAGLPTVASEYAPDVLADEVVAFELINGTVRITLGVIKMAEPAPPSPNQMVVLGRLVVGIESAQRLALGLFDYLRQQGHDPQTLLASADAKPH